MTKDTNKIISDIMVVAYQYQKHSDTSGAIKEWNKLLKLAIDKELKAITYLNLGKLHELEGSLDLAYDNITLAIASNPNSAAAYFCLAYIEQQQQDYNKATKTFKKALDIDNKDVGAWNNLGNCYDSLNELDQAISAYNKAILLDKNYISAIYNRANAYNKQGHYKYAIADLTMAIKLDNNFYQAYYNRGIIYKKIGNIKKSAADLQIAKDIAKKELKHTK